MTFRIYPYMKGSASVSRLKDSLSAMIIKTENSKYRYRPSHTVINWGSSKLPDSLMVASVLNPAPAVAIATNKLKALELLEDRGVSTVPFTTDVDEAMEWLEEGYKVFVRNKLTGHSGEGIEVVEKQESPNKNYLISVSEGLYERHLDDMAYEIDKEIESLTSEQVDLPDAPLYTRGVQNKGEYRVHVMNGEVILYQKKSRRVDDDGEQVTEEGRTADVRNLSSNWIYRTGNLERLDRIEELAIEAVEALDLDFGAVDIINDNDSAVYVLEINCAPGLLNTDSLEAYTEGFNKLA